MKYAFRAILGVVVVASIRCHVTSPASDTEPTTAGSVVNHTAKIPIEVKTGVEKNYDSLKLTKAGVKSVYLEDVLFALRQQNWTSAEENCLNDTLLLLRSLQNFTLWAVWDWDSISSEPQGLLFGSRYQLGNFDECMHAPWQRSHPELRSQYCLADIELERTDRAVRRKINEPFDPYQSALDFIEHKTLLARPLNKLTWGTCVPDSCQPHSVERLLRTMLARSHIGTAGLRANIALTTQCQRAAESRPYDGLFYSFICLVCVLVGTAWLCTYLNWRREKTNEDDVKTGIIRSFCLRENAENLLTVKDEGAGVLYGIRFLTICFIVLDHQIGIFNSGPISNGLIVDEEAASTAGMLILHDDLFVDTFFLLSGFLVATKLTSFKRLPHPIFIILKRYVRLVVAFAMVIFYICAVFPYSGSGPLWPQAVQGETDYCRKNWWLSLLMVGNYIDTENICMVVSWYIPCDFHYMIITSVLYWIYRRHRKTAIVSAVVVTIAAVITPGIINWMNNLPAVQLFTYEFIAAPRRSAQFHQTYIKSHTRFAAYIVGFFSGYLFQHYKHSPTAVPLSKGWSLLGSAVGVMTMLAVMVVGTTFLWRPYEPLEGALYAAVNRPLWAVGLAMLVLSCCLGNVPLVTPLLSWYPWAPLSRLAYGLYLTHAAIIARNVFVTRNPHTNDYMILFTNAIGVIFTGCVAALLLWLFAEAPANRLLNLCLIPRRRKQREHKPSTQSVDLESARTGGADNRGFLQENLPPKVQQHFHSKF